jgi:hypothetical protein
MLAGMVRCEECGCASESAKGWFGAIAVDPKGEDVQAIVFTYCPPCAERRLDAKPAEHEYV